MKTYMANAQTVERKWYVVDAAGIPLGRLASKVAAILRGKNKPTFTPNVDTGDFVIVINSDKVVLTGKKLENKFYRYHTGYIGGLKEIAYGKTMADRSDLVVYEAVRGMHFAEYMTGSRCNDMFLRRHAEESRPAPEMSASANNARIPEM